MKIIKQGDLSRLRHPMLFTCSKCGCEFEADDSEYEHRDHGPLGEEYMCICPCCDERAYIRGVMRC